MKNPTHKIFDTKRETFKGHTKVVAMVLPMIAFTERKLSSMDYLYIATEYEEMVRKLFNEM